MGSVIRGVYGFLSRTVTERWAGSLHAGALVRGLYLQWTLRPLLRGRTGIAFDAGCGRGAEYARVLARRFPGWRFVGLDLKLSSPERRPRNLSLCVGDLRALPVGGPFDLIYSADVLEHLENPQALLVDFARCLRREGMLILQVPSRRQRYFLPGVDREYSWLGPPEPGDAHVWEGFEPAALEKWLSQAGFEMVWARYTVGGAVAILKELFMLGEERRIPGIGLCLFPFLALAAWLDWRWGGRRGNGLLVLARRQEA